MVIQNGRFCLHLFTRTSILRDMDASMDMAIVFVYNPKKGCSYSNLFKLLNNILHVSYLYHYLSFQEVNETGRK